MRNFVAILAGFGLAVSTATQLRGEDIPLGPGEAVLLAWMLLVLTLLLRRVRFTFGRVFWVLILYTLASWTVLAFGAMAAVAIRQFDPRLAEHDVLALAFASVFACLLAVRLFDDGTNRYHFELARATFIAFTLMVGTVLAIALVAPSALPLNLWYGGVRFSGWAFNPNQMALAAAPMPFLGVYLLRRTRQTWRRAAYAIAIGVCVVIGIATQSDALRVGWVAALGVVAIMYWYRVILRGSGAGIAVGHLVVPLVAGVLVYALADEIVPRIEQILSRMYEEGDQGNIRISLWLTGIEVIRRSPVVGFGPGAFSGPFPFAGSEAHNSLIDWGMSTGLLGLAMHLGLWLWCTVRAFRSNSFALLGAFTAVIAFSMFGYALRQPVYWLTIVLTLVLSERRGAAVVLARHLAARARAQPPLRPTRLAKSPL